MERSHESAIHIGIREGCTGRIGRSQWVQKREASRSDRRIGGSYIRKAWGKPPGLAFALGKNGVEGAGVLHPGSN